MDGASREAWRLLRLNERGATAFTLRTVVMEKTAAHACLWPRDPERYSATPASSFEDPPGCHRRSRDRHERATSSTVGAVALAPRATLAAATSTG